MTKLSDNQVDDLLAEVRARLDGAVGETIQGQTALKAASANIGLLALGLVKASVHAELRAHELPEPPDRR